MNRVSTVSKTNVKSQQATKSLIKQRLPLSQPDLNLFSKDSFIDTKSRPSGFDLTQIPIHPVLYANEQIQCCAKDGAGCSCPKCQEAANENGDPEEQQETTGS